jgi:hypothetical protein
MIIQISTPPNFKQEAKRLRAQASLVLRTWGLVPRFKRWRLSQDPKTGMIVLFGILNDKYIARHTLIPFSNYFDSHLLHDLSNKLQVQIVSGNSDGLGYAFILSRGQIDFLPAQVNTSFLDEDKLFPIYVNDWSVLEFVEGRIRLSHPNAGTIIGDAQT